MLIHIMIVCVFRVRTGTNNTNHMGRRLVSLPAADRKDMPRLGKDATQMRLRKRALVLSATIVSSCRRRWSFL